MRSRKRRGCGETTWKRRRRQAFVKYGKLCKWCGTSENITVDHVIPPCKGGTNNLSNLQILCEKCNNIKIKYIDSRLLKI